MAPQEKMIVIYNRQNQKIATFVFHQGNEGFLFSEISLVISFQITPFIKRPESIPS
ncbi:hypothetical protein ABQD81_06985 [Enterococcus casseliflavus]|jgi:hypothetical protein|nr:predicted protein [Enterococcus casseliflavus EC30]MDO0907259.1 hypothetical protein [Enterococcus sp. B2E4]